VSGKGRGRNLSQRLLYLLLHNLCGMIVKSAKIIIPYIFCVGRASKWSPPSTSHKHECSIRAA